jgi:hypothetical protein
MHEPLYIPRRRLLLPPRFGGLVRQRGTFHGRLLGPDGKVIEDGISFPNAATTEGVNYLLDAGFKGGTPITTWYFGLITGPSHPGWTENTDYSGDRKTWTTGTIASGSLPTGTAASFTFTSAGTVRGIFVTSIVTKSTTTGTMWATAIDTTNRSVANGQTLQIYYTNNLTPVS